MIIEIFTMSGSFTAYVYSHVDIQKFTHDFGTLTYFTMQKPFASFPYRTQSFLAQYILSLVFFNLHFLILIQFSKIGSNLPELSYSDNFAGTNMHHYHIILSKKLFYVEEYVQKYMFKIVPFESCIVPFCHIPTNILNYS